MPLGKEFSLVADSTVSSSPTSAADAPEVIKRPARTYGRRRDEPPVETFEKPTLYSEPVSASYDNVHHTAPPGLQEEICGSSPTSEGHSIREHTAGRSSARSPQFGFGWRAKLKELEDSFADEDEASSNGAAMVVDAPKQRLFGPALLLQEAKEITKPSDSTLESPSSFAIPSISDDVFGGPPSSPCQNSTLRLPSPHGTRRGHSRRKVIPDSDSDEELPDSSSTAASTSSKRLIDASHSRSSSTQPTSEDDMPPKPTTKQQRPTGSRKTSSSRLSVPPLDFGAVPSSDLKTRKKDIKRKVKAPTKKDKTETAKERGRLAAQTTVSIPRAENTSKFTMQALLKKLGKQTETLASDPIEAFSSSPAKATAQSPEKEVASRQVSRAPSPVGLVIPALDDSDDDLPEVRDIFNTNTKKSDALLAIKQRYITETKPTAPEDDDDDLFIQSDPKAAVKDEEDRRCSPQKPRISAARKVVTRLGQVNASKQAKKALISPQKRFSSIAHKETVAESTAELNAITLARAHEASRRETRKKEEEWSRHGGHLNAQQTALPQDLDKAMQEIARNGLEAARARGADLMDVDDEGEDDSDEEYVDPALRGSASPEPEEDDDEEAENDENMPLDGDTTMVAEVDDADEENMKGVPGRRNIVQSDSEEEYDENAPIKLSRPLPRQKIRRASLSSELSTEEEDKENNTKLMYDHSEDKENTRVVRHSPLSTPGSSVDRTLRSIPASPIQGGHDLDVGVALGSAKRKPFQDISEEPFGATQLQPTNLTQSFASMLQQASPLPSTLAPAPTLKTFLEEGGSKSFGRFSQFSEGNLETFGAAPLQASFSELFESGTEKQKSLTSLGKRRASDEIFSDENENDGSKSRILQRTDTLDLTQDTTAVKLRPAVQAEGAWLRKTDAIFEKEQEFVLEANTRKPVRENTELYVNDLGFLTQTKPVDTTPELYRRPPPQSMYGTMLSPSQARLTPTQPRAPLRTLSYSNATPTHPESPEQPLRRLRKHSDTPPRDTPRSRSISPPPLVQPKRNAFTELFRAQAREKKAEDRKQRKREIDGFLEDEAAESDEENNFGFAKPKVDAEEEEGEDLDKALDELMDDQAMDSDTEAADLVQEKHQEHMEEDDKKLEEIAHAAAHGELRKKRRHGVGVDDSDDEYEGEGNEKARRAMKKLRKSERGDIKDLEACEETRPFANTYYQTLKDDDDHEFEYLNQVVDVDDIFVDKSSKDVGSDEEMEVGDDEEEEEEKTVDVREVLKEVLQQARTRVHRSTSPEEFDTEDVSWIDGDERMEESPKVKTVVTRQRPPPPQHDMDYTELDGAAFRPSSVLPSAASKQWSVQENKSRRGGTSRSVGGSAITGHAKAKPKTGAGGPARKGPLGTSSGSSSSTAVNTVKAAPSMLSVVDKSRNFG